MDQDRYSGNQKALARENNCCAHVKIDEADRRRTTPRLSTLAYRLVTDAERQFDCWNFSDAGALSMWSNWGICGAMPIAPWLAKELGASRTRFFCFWRYDALHGLSSAAVLTRKCPLAKVGEYSAISIVSKADSFGSYG
jgi:hypothetical protein